jgi:uncharacterized protein
LENLFPYLTSIQELSKRCDVKTPHVFGSVLTGRFGWDSDIDFIVDLFENDPLEYTEKYYNLKFGLEKILSRPLDLLEERSHLNPVVRKGTERSKMMEYEG